MICHRTSLAEQAAKTLERSDTIHLDRALSNIAAFKTRLAPPTTFSDEAFGALDQAVWDLRVSTLGVEEASIPSPEDGKRSPVETY